ncbi:MAG: AsnC family transcriptional regulator, partial [Microbacterium sp. 14-71-5]
MDDPVDLAILAAISQDGRATLAHLSETVGLSVSAVQARLRRLESRGVISGYRPVI